MGDVLAIVGSLKVRPEQLAEARRVIEGVLDRKTPDLIVSGGADGIDRLAKVIGEEWGIEVDERKPRVRRWAGPGGFAERNLEIARRCTRLLCIRSHQSRTYGSGWTADRAEELGKLVWRVTV